MQGAEMNNQITIRNAVPSDLEAVIVLDEVDPEDAKPAYWRGVFEHYVRSEREERLCLVAEAGKEVIGFIIGEVRAWEFGSPPCGWVFALTVSPKARQKGIGHLMFEEICRRMKQSGIKTVRTMVNLDDTLTLSFFRSQGMRTGRYIELEKLLDSH